MIKMKQLLMAAAIAILFTACDNGKTMIKGTATGIEEMTLIDVGGEKPDTMATVAVADGKFSYEIKADSMSLYFLYAGERFAIPLFIAPGETVELEMNVADEGSTYEVSGSPESERVKKITMVVEEAMVKVDSLGTILQTAQQDSNFAMMKMQLDSAFRNIVENAAERYRKMIDENPGSIANVFIFSQSIGQNPVLSPQEDFEYVEKVGEGLKKEYPDMAITENFNQNVEKMRQQVEMQKQMEQIQQGVSQGKEAPEIALPNPNGEIMKLSDLRGKVVLVDFWAAWCRPCRAENPNLVRIYNEYKDEGFEVFSVSLDGVERQQNPKEQWVAAIEQDQLNWDTHVSDLQGWQSSVVPKFGFQGIPYTVLVDRDGKIIATKLRGPELEAKLKEVLGKS